MTRNHVTVEGDVLTGPELRYTGSGTAVATFRIKAGEHDGSRLGVREDAECWVDVTCFGELAERVGESLRVGHRAVVIGRLTRQSWENEKGPGTKLSVRAFEVAGSLRHATGATVAASPPGSRPVGRGGR